MLKRKLIGIRVLMFSGIFIVLAIIGFKVAHLEIPVEVGVVGTMYTFFYGLFINSMFKFLDEKYTAYRNFLGDFIGRVQSIYNVSILTKNKKFISDVRIELVEFSRTFLTLTPEHYYQNQKHINKLYKLTNDLTIRTPKDAQLYSRLLSFCDNLSVTREKIEIFAHKNFDRSTKIIFIASTGIFLLLIAFITFSQKNLYVNITGILLILIAVFMVIFMLELDNLTYEDYAIRKKNIESLIDLIDESHK